MFFFVSFREWLLIILLVNVLQHRRLSYSRHAVDDRDLTTQVTEAQYQFPAKSNEKDRMMMIFFSICHVQQVNYKMHMNIRRMNDRKHHKRSKRGSGKVS